MNLPANTQLSDVLNQRVTVIRRYQVSAYLSIGQELLKAKDECQHGQWAIFLDECGINQRHAQQIMQVTRAVNDGLLTARAVKQFGLKASLKQLAKPREAAPAQASTEGTQEIQHQQETGKYNLGVLIPHLAGIVANGTARQCAAALVALEKAGAWDLEAGELLLADSKLAEVACDLERRLAQVPDYQWPDACAAAA